jgi:hypothetical protein
MIDYVESFLLDKMAAGDTTAIIFFLKCRAKSRGYVEKSQNDISSKEVVISFSDQIKQLNAERQPYREQITIYEEEEDL